MKIWSRVFAFDVLAVLLGCTLTFAFAPYEIFPLAFISPAGLLALWLNTGPKRAAWLGFVFGMGFFGTGVYWVYHSVHVFGGVAGFPAFLITAAFIAILALFPAGVGYTLNRFFPYPTAAKILCAFPAIWVFIEWFRSWICTGFPWLFLGYSQTNSPLKGYAPLLSVYGVSLAVLLTSAALVNGVRDYQRQQFRALYLNLLLIALIWIGGGFLSLIPWTNASGKPITVSLVQGNIPQALKWSPEHLQLSFDRYQELSQKEWAKNKLIIWPEAAIPVPLQNTMDFINQLDHTAATHGANLILGIPIQVVGSDKYYNAIVTLGSKQQVYVKRQLVPFGEYTPLSQWLSHFMQIMDIPMSDLVPGKIAQAPLEINGVKILPSICYEIAFPELMNTRDPNIGILLTITNDAWFGKSSAQAQHLQMAKMRAIELARPLLFVSNDGITAIIAPDGKVETAAPTHIAYVLDGNIQPTNGLTPWMKNGMDPILFILICLLIFAMRENLKAAPKQIKNNEDNLIRE